MRQEVSRILEGRRFPLSLFEEVEEESTFWRWICNIAALTTLFAFWLILLLVLIPVILVLIDFVGTL